jgi:predicted N-acetyltransferase YhbS
MIRSATPDDVESIRELMQSEPGLWQEGWRPDVLERGIGSANGLTFVWEENERIIGFICAHDLGFRAYLSELVVAPSARGKGIGKKLLKHVECKLIESGCTLLIADVWRNAQKFYSALGWSEPDAVLLRKKLPRQGQPIV